MRYVIALGGNALIPPGGAGTAEEQTTAVAATMARLAPLAADGHELLITHGNGPQVGNLLLKNEVAAHLVPPMPLDWCVAQTQATIGLAIETALEHELRRRGVERRVVVVLTRVKVDPLDPARGRYTKPIGRTLTAAEGAAVNFGQPAQRTLERVNPAILRGFQAAGHFSDGSMGPKVEAALRFVEAGGERAVIAGLGDAAEAVAGERGTQLIRR